MNFEALPTELKKHKNWILWKSELRGQRLTKVPYQVNGSLASSTEPQHWSSFDEVISRVQNYDGIGFVFSENDEFTGVDLDKCIDEETGEIEQWALDIIERLDSYTEISPSGKGLHVIVKTALPSDLSFSSKGRRKDKLEIYSQGRYFTMTGNVFEQKPVAARLNTLMNILDEMFVRRPEPPARIEEQSISLIESLPAPNHAAELSPPQRFEEPIIIPAQEESGFIVERRRPARNIVESPDELSDMELLEIAQRSRSGRKFNKLWQGDISDYASHSDADMAFASLLAFFTGHNIPRMDRLFRMSRLMREKWNRDDYRNATLTKACERTDKYDPKHGLNVKPLAYVHPDMTPQRQVTVKLPPVPKIETIFLNGNIQKNIMPFWYFKTKGKEQVLAIDIDSFIQFLTSEGFAKMFVSDSQTGVLFVREQNRILEEVSPVQIKDYVIEFISKLPDLVPCKFRYQDDEEEVRTVSRDAIRQQIMNQHDKLFKDKALEFLPTKIFDILRDTAQEAYFLFRNCIVKVTPTDRQTIQYVNLEHYVWKARILTRDYCASDDEISIQEQFYEKICSTREQSTYVLNPQKYNTLRTATGYMLHGYKDPANAKALILTDETLADEPSGRTGKGLVSRGLHYFRNTVRIDAKKFDVRDQFAFQNVELDTEILEFNDIKKNFDFESLFGAITEGMMVNKKNKAQFILKFEQSPKVLITTNYAIDGTGPSHRARRIEIELSDYFKEAHTPIDEFGMRLYDGYTPEEWHRFDNFMLDCVQLYLTHGLTGYEGKNNNIKKLIRMTNESFHDFIFAEIIPGKQYIYKELFEKYIAMYFEGSEKEKPSANIFSRWLSRFGSIYGLKITKDRIGSTRDRSVIFEPLANSTFEPLPPKNQKNSDTISPDLPDTDLPF